MNVTRRRVNVVIVVVLFLLAAGILLPAVKRVHMAAEKMQCQNHLKQLGLGECDFEQTMGHRVQGTFPNPALGPEDRMSWCFALLPYIESDPTYRTTKRDKAWNDPANELLKMRWSPFVCPARPDYETSQQTSYLGMAGLGEDAATLPTKDPRIGIFGYDRKVRLEDIKDGTANTISPSGITYRWAVGTGRAGKCAWARDKSTTVFRRVATLWFVDREESLADSSAGDDHSSRDG